MRLPVHLSLRSKSVLFLILYTMVLEGSILTYFYYSGKGSIQRRASLEVKTEAGLAQNALKEALSASLTELVGLRSQLQLYFALPGSPPRLRPLEELVISMPKKYAEIGLLDLRTRQMLTIHAAREFNQVYAIASSRVENQIAGECPPTAGAQPIGKPCVLGLEPGAQGERVVFIVPLIEDKSRVLVAYAYLESLFDSVNRLALPANLSIVISNSQGLILFAPEIAQLRTYLPSSIPELGFPSDPKLLSTGKILPMGSQTVYWERIPPLNILVAARKDDEIELHELRMKLVGMVLFVALITLLAFTGVWVLTGRMAESLDYVTEVANSVALGDFSRKITIHRNDELGLLIDRFNSMTEQLEGNYRALKDVNQKLQAKIHELTRTRRRLTQKQRLALVGEAISKVSHEIQNKIGGAGVWVQNLERFGAKDENSVLCLGELKSALAASLDMLVHFKRFYREPQLEKGKVPAVDLIEACLKRVATEVQAKELNVAAQVECATSYVEVDAPQMTDAITNILLNAVYFSPVGGTLTVSLRKGNETIVLACCDQGPGIQNKEKLFQPFYTTKPSGSGLGLAIVRNIVVAHSGRIRAYNSPGGGACFEISLPDAGLQAGSADPPEEKGAALKQICS
jgi:signal transduction histidine kinase